MWHALRMKGVVLVSLRVTGNPRMKELKALHAHRGTLSVPHMRIPGNSCLEIAHGQLAETIHEVVGRTEQTPFVPELRSLFCDHSANIVSYCLDCMCAVPAMGCATLAYTNNPGFSGRVDGPSRIY